MNTIRNLVQGACIFAVAELLAIVPSEGDGPGFKLDQPRLYSHRPGERLRFLPADYSLTRSV